MAGDLLNSRRGAALVAAAIAVVFVALRVTLLAAREPFFDELFTAWIVRKPFAGILEALRHDSGPPLYYFVTHLLGLRSVAAIRALSLIAASATFAVVVAARSLGSSRFVAAALLAVYPPAVLFAVDARAYALCGMLVAAGIVALWSGRRPVAAIAFVAAAYCHYYGVLFFPLMLVPVPGSAESESEKTTILQRVAGFGIECTLFAPGFWLAAHQPRQSMSWLREPAWSWVSSLSFAGDYPYGLFASSPGVLVAIAGVLLLACLIAPLPIRRAGRSPLYSFAAAATLIPLALAVATRVYFPMRFGAVVAVPLALWIAASAGQFEGLLRRATIGIFFAIGLVATYGGIVDHARRPLDSYRDAAAWAARHAAPGQKIVASGYCYLEAVMAAPANVVAFPEEQAIHPGWRALPRRDSVPPAPPFLWIGERAAPELSILKKTSAVQPVYSNGHALVALVR